MTDIPSHQASLPDEGKKIYVIHENDKWVTPLRSAFSSLKLPAVEWFLHEGTLDLDAVPPEGVYYNRMSASSHTRGHRYSVEYTFTVLAWLEAHGRKIFNGRNALEFEINKALQYATLKKYGVPIPKTIVTVGSAQILKAATEHFPDTPFITKDNRGGSGSGVRLWRSIDELKSWIESSSYSPPLDGVTLVQQYVENPHAYITRCEFIQGEFLYAVRVLTDSNNFNLCPADHCIPKSKVSNGSHAGQTLSNCPGEEVKETKQTEEKAPPAKFTILKNFTHPLLATLSKFLKDNEISVSGIEFVEDQKGNYYVYDVNTNTNYNGDAEKIAGLELTQTGMGAIARALGRELPKDLVSEFHSKHGLSRKGEADILDSSPTDGARKRQRRQSK